MAPRVSGDRSGVNGQWYSLNPIIGLNPSRLALQLCNPVPMKNKNKRELEKRWKTEAAKKRKAAEKKTTRREDVNQAAAGTVREATENS